MPSTEARQSTIAGASACSCEYPCSCVAEARERAKDARITEARERSLRDQVASTPRWWMPDRKAEIMATALSGLESTLRWWKMRAVAVGHRADRFEAAIEKHRATAGSVLTARDMELYRALDAEED